MGVLTEEQALEIINSTKPRTVLAKKYRVSPPTIYSIKSGKTWKHLKRPKKKQLLGNDLDKVVVREKDGRWKKGQSGNPYGKNIWNSEERVECVRKLNKAYSGITEKAIEMALNGDEGIIRLIMERVLPARSKDNPAPKGLLVGTLEEQAYNVMKAMDVGLLTPMEGKELLAGIKSTQEITEFSEFKREIENIKKMLEGQ